MSIILGTLTVVIGSYGIYHWWGDFLTVFKGLLPLSFVCGGLIAILAGISALRKS